ncbi:MAG: DNA-processing protein DprA [Pseudonocardiaceae bacterium]
MSERRVRLARVWLNRVAEPPAPALAALVESEGPVAAARAVAAGEVPSAVTAETAARRGEDRAEADLAAAEALGGRFVVPEDQEWPAWAFAAYRTPPAWADDRLCEPLGLWVRGTMPVDEVADAAVAVVGARAATGYGEHVAADFGLGLAERGLAVVSGAAFGIDGAAHRGALAGDGVTAAVLACGLDHCYPAGHAGLLDRIASQGAVVTEYPPGVRPARHRFLVRNGIIAALSGGTVVVEAGARSGARRTAGLAAVLGRVVMAVPGPVTSVMSVGCHELLRDEHAVLVTRVEEIAEAVGRIGADLATPRPSPTRPTDGLSAEQAAVYEALPARAGRYEGRLARDSGVPVDRVRAVLPLLELQGLVRAGTQGWRRTPPPGRGGA